MSLNETIIYWPNTILSTQIGQKLIKELLVLFINNSFIKALQVSHKPIRQVMIEEDVHQPKRFFHRLETQKVNFIKGLFFWKALINDLLTINTDISYNF